MKAADVAQGPTPAAAEAATTIRIPPPGDSLTAADDLTKVFVAPPESAKPWAYWFRQNGQITQEGITRDFQEMSAKGVGGVILWDQFKYYSGAATYVKTFDLQEGAKGVRMVLDLG